MQVVEEGEDTTFRMDVYVCSDECRAELLRHVAGTPDPEREA